MPKCEFGCQGTIGAQHCSLFLFRITLLQMAQGCSIGTKSLYKQEENMNQYEIKTWCQTWSIRLTAFKGQIQFQVKPVHLVFLDNHPRLLVFLLQKVRLSLLLRRTQQTLQFRVERLISVHMSGGHQHEICEICWLSPPTQLRPERLWHSPFRRSSWRDRCRWVLVAALDMLFSSTSRFSSSTM